MGHDTGSGFCAGEDGQRVYSFPSGKRFELVFRYPHEKEYHIYFPVSIIPEPRLYDDLCIFRYRQTMLC